MINGNDLIGTQIGNYRIVSYLDSGGFGDVYKGEHIYVPDYLVAIKFLRSLNLHLEHNREKFLQEASLLAKLRQMPSRMLCKDATWRKNLLSAT